MAYTNMNGFWNTVTLDRSCSFMFRINYVHFKLNHPISINYFFPQKNKMSMTVLDVNVQVIQKMILPVFCMKAVVIMATDSTDQLIKNVMINGQHKVKSPA